MTKYSVEITALASAALREYARYIAVDCEAPLNARRWLASVLECIDSLEQFPSRAPLALEDAFVPYEVRQLVIGDYLALFTFDDHHRTVWILDFRHGYRLPRPFDLPEKPPTLDHR